MPPASKTFPEAIAAKDVRSLRYVFVNRAAEKLFDLPRARIDLEFGGFLGCRERGLQGFDLRYGNAVIGIAIKAEHGCLHLGRKLRRALRPQRIWRIDRRAIERDAGLEVAAVGGIFPNR